MSKRQFAIRKLGTAAWVSPPRARILAQWLNGPDGASLYLPFDSLLSLPTNLVSFTRTGSAWYFNSAGVYTEATTDQPRFDFDPVTLQPRGLLMESARTNLLLNSATLSTQNVTTTAAAHTLTFYGTGTITLSGTSTAGPLVGTGANNRVALTFTPTAGTLTLTVTGTVTNAQLELGSFATSYIPTAGATVTRAAGTLRIPTLSSIGFSDTEGTIVVEAMVDNTSTTQSQPIFTFSDGTNNNRIQRSLTTSVISRYVVGGVATNPGDNSAALITPYVPFKTGMTWAVGTNQAISCLNGTLTTAASPASALTAAALTDGLRLGAQPAAIGTVTGVIWLRRVTYFSRRLTNAELQALCT